MARGDGEAGVTLAGCQTFLARRLNQSHRQVGRPSLLGYGGLLPNFVLEMSWKSGQTKYSKKWDSLFCVCFGETNVHQHTL